MSRTEADELRFKQPDGIVTAAKLWGEETATVNVIAVHGFLDSASTFDNIAPRILKLSNNQIRIVCVDLSGHGKSDHRTEPSIYHQCWITEIINVADALGWDTFSLMGHSMGTGIVLTVAGAIPHRVKKVIFLDGLGHQSAEAEMAPILLEKALQQRLQLLTRQPRTYESYTKLIERIQQSDSKLSFNSAKLLADRDSTNVQGGFMFAHDPRLKGRTLSFIVITEPEILAYIKRISCPVLVLWATYRWYPLDEEKLRARERQFADITVKVIEGNHHVHLENPERCDTIIAQFLLSHSSKL